MDRIRDGSENPTLFSVDCSEQPDRTATLVEVGKCPNKKISLFLYFF
jgi:hypothetical protein